MKSRITRNFIAILALLGIALLASGCNTMRGFGKDLSKVGQKIEGAASH